MPYPSKWRKIERKYGEPINRLLPRLINELGSKQAVAKHLGISGAAVTIMSQKLGMRCVWVSEPEEKSAAK